jgi:hypothetical protein
MPVYSTSLSAQAVTNAARIAGRISLMGLADILIMMYLPMLD